MKTTWEIDWDDAFSNMAYIPGSDAMPDQWAQYSANFRDRRRSTGKVQLDQSYGDEARQNYDVFEPEGPIKGTLIIVHGGYWVKFDKSYWSFLAEGPLQHGWRVAVISYPLAPSAPISEITNSVQKAVTAIGAAFDGSLRLIGHSAGGHLVTRMACKGVLYTEIKQRIERIVSVGGLYDLRPLLNTKLNDELRLSLDTAASESPALLDPASIPLTVWVGANDRPEFIRQNRVITESWTGKGADLSSTYDPGHDHFTVIDQLRDPKSDLTQETLRQNSI